LSLVLVVCLIATSLVACSSKKQVVPDPKPRPTGTSFGGVWYSDQFEHMFLRQQGDKVRGIYSYDYGGTLEGTVEGNLMKFQWIDPGSKEEARRSFEGRGYFQLVQEGDSVRLVGKWGYGESYTGGGPWTAERVRDIDPEDPQTLEDLRKSNEY
jgi:hypothetical protein